MIANGLVNDILRITLPADGDASLGDLVPKDRRDGVMTWRVDCESSTGDLSISLGLLQVWAMSNADQSFATICSNHVRPSDAMMAWLAALDNVVVGHSVAAWFSPEELESRFAAIERFLEWGIPTVIWIVTDPEWDNEPVLARALELVGSPDCIIEEPHRPGQSEQCPPVLHVNPAGPCSANRQDGKKRNLEFVTSADGGPDDYVVRLGDGTFEQPSGGVHSAAGAAPSAAGRRPREARTPRVPAECCADRVDPTRPSGHRRPTFDVVAATSGVRPLTPSPLVLTSHPTTRPRAAGSPRWRSATRRPANCVEAL